MKQKICFPSVGKESISAVIRLISALCLLIFTLVYVLPQSGVIADKTENILAEISDTDKNGYVIQNISGVKKEESTAEATTLALLNEEEKNSASFSTPPDILEMQEEYVAAFSQSKANGVVSQESVSTKGATDIVGNVAVRNCTAEQKPDFNALLQKGIILSEVNYDEPLVLIFHTHTTEGYLCVDDGVFYDSFETRSSDSTRNMVRIGDEICRVLEENSIGFVHDTKIYDESYNGAYSRSRMTVLQYLKQYPSIQIVLDVHRDAVYYSDTKRAKFVSEINGKKAAQIMIITGAQEGLVTDFPDWEENLTFALSLQKYVQNDSEGLMKPIYFCQRKYNMDVVPYSVLLEVGTDANTLEEAVYSAHLFGKSLARLIKENISEKEEQYTEKQE